MKKYVVAYCDLIIGNIEIYFINANNEKEAVINTICKKYGCEEMVQYIPNSLENIKNQFINWDSIINIKEIPKDIINE